MGWALAGTGNSSAVAVVVAPQNMCFLVNGFLCDGVENERSRRDTTAILIVRTLRIFLDVPKKVSFSGEGLSAQREVGPRLMAMAMVMDMVMAMVMIMVMAMVMAMVIVTWDYNSHMRLQ